MKIGLFFGTFNPIHIGHLIIAHYMAEFTDLNEVWLVVSPHNPFKKKENLLNEDERLRLVQLATETDPKLKASSIEFELPKPSYTTKTLDYLHEHFNKDEFVLVMGSDTLDSVPDWKEGEKILEENPIYVYPRPTHPEINLMEHPNIKVFEVPLLNISASFVREGLESDKDMRYFLPGVVNDYIKTNHLYKKEVSE